VILLYKQIICGIFEGGMEKRNDNIFYINESLVLYAMIPSWEICTLLYENNIGDSAELFH
jgi:hypothetical protein